LGTHPGLSMPIPYFAGRETATTISRDNRNLSMHGREYVRRIINMRGFAVSEARVSLESQCMNGHYNQLYGGYDILASRFSLVRTVFKCPAFWRDDWRFQYW
jgi:hypothetical protein